MEVLSTLLESYSPGDLPKDPEYEQAEREKARLSVGGETAEARVCVDK